MLQAESNTSNSKQPFERKTAMKKIFVVMLVLLSVMTAVNSYFLWMHVSNEARNEADKDKIAPALIGLGFDNIQVKESCNDFIYGRRARTSGRTYQVLASKNLKLIKLEVFQPDDYDKVIVWEVIDIHAETTKNRLN